ncbi:hypothetical protein BDF19DRAFT_433724 [Syncephalis fuscata]|nr:hypothetical protein BDF19DRAFT_433724 [Syncephalis fuscata]
MLQATLSKQCIYRKYSNGNRIRRFSTPEEVSYIIQNFDNFNDFWARIEGTPHSGVHVNIGGRFATMASSTDPLFFLHHANVDRFWAQWQARGPEQAMAAGNWGPNMELAPWGAVVSSVLDTQSDDMCYVYANPVKAYENQNTQGRLPALVKRSADTFDQNKSTNTIANATAASSNRINLIHPAPMAPLPESWKRIYKQLNQVSGYISPAALWHRNELLRRVIESDKATKFTVDVDGKSVELPTPTQSNSAKAIVQLKQSAIDAGVQVDNDKAMLKSLSAVVGSDGVVSLANLFQGTSAFGRVFKNTGKNVQAYVNNLLDNSTQVQ